MAAKRKFGELSIGGAGDTAGADRAAFEKQHVHAVYDAIAPHFSSTRYKAWPQVGAFVASQPPGSVIVDVGCGNGKSLADVLGHKDKIVLACDASKALLDLARGKGLECQQVNALRLPYPSARCDCVISIAMLHHLSTPQRRHTALSEMSRVLRPGGRLLVYVWAKNQKRFAGAASQDVTVPWTVHEKFVKAKATESEAAEPPLNPCTNTPQHDRFYHLFVQGELEDLLRDLPLNIQRSYYDCDNWCISAVKADPVPAAAEPLSPDVQVE
ncbi:tRNA (carboxymethyluridine(34)-5-O)-methyltransferase [Diplonema papillatum]|nr:tRNA (carboxymethyluridine(34)-5-O)-methyltransferase [Diplonema papillatum]|eukprot:gene10416-16050_t